MKAFGEEVCDDVVLLGYIGSRRQTDGRSPEFSITTVG